ncbi:MAG: PDZ domain-containing protein [Candidatus Aenigmarchaeota archaeon]|nr:PDZ domain-containing protein [Candidatus Aenigmarchaeota archaeon]
MQNYHPYQNPSYKPPGKLRTKKWRRVITIFSLVVLVVFSYGLGWAVGHGNLQIEKGRFLPVINKEHKGTSDINFGMFWKAWDYVDNEFAGGEIDHLKMLYGAISGMLSALDDPYTAFMTPEETKKFDEELSGSISGIGAEVGIKSDKLTIIAPIKDTPAERAGLKAGDIILKVDGEETVNMSLEEAVSKIRGEKGTVVTLTISRSSFPEPRDFKIERAIIKIVSVDWEMKGDGIAYIQISRFSNDTSSRLREIANEILAQGGKGIILDLRNNPGGYLDSAISVASEFLSQGTVVIEKRRDGTETKWEVKDKGRLTDTSRELVVLVNKGSASASEIVAGAIQDAKRGILIGEATFGKGLVQEIKDLGGGASMRITIAKWYTPSGRSINEQGLSPDIEVELTDEDFNADRDPQLDRALQYLKDKIK